MRNTGVKVVKYVGRKLGLKKVWQKMKDFKETAIDKEKYRNDINLYIKMNTRKEFAYNKKFELPCIHEWRGQAGNAGAYFWQDLWGAQRIIAHHPQKHYDIGSRVDGFISHMLLFPEIELHCIDIRPMEPPLPGTHFKQANATNLDGIEDNSIESLSALCSLEHFGLGRYGDPIDPEACFKAFKAVQRVVKKNGYIYISVPVGEDYVCFNAHRVFKPATILKEFAQCECEEFSVIDGNVDHVVSKISNPETYRLDPEKGYYCGLFMFRKV